MKPQFRIALIFCVLINSCTRKHTPPRDLSEMDVISINSESIMDEFNISEMIDTFFRVPLETLSETLIGEIDQVFVVNDNIIVVDKDKSKSILCFDFSGRFKFRIGGWGRGPGEYSDLTDTFIHPDQERIGVLAIDRILWYSTETGRFLMNGPRFKNVLPKRIKMMDSLTYVVYTNNSCNDFYCHDFLFMNMEGEIIGRQNRIDRRFKNVFINNKTPFGGNESYYSQYNDTLYTYNDSGLMPKYFFDFENRRLPKNLYPKSTSGYQKFIGEVFKEGKTFGLIDVYETTNHMFYRFHLGYPVINGFYNKTTGNSIHMRTMQSPLNLYFNNVVAVHNDYMISLIESDWIQYCKKLIANNEKSDVIEAFGKEYFDLINEIEDDPNPILTFVKFKWSE